MLISAAGLKMAQMSGIRTIMEDIATTTAGSTRGRWLNLGIGNPAYIPAVTSAWQQLAAEALASGFSRTSCTYGASRGAPDLLDAVASYFNTNFGWDITERNVVVAPGSQLLGFIAATLFSDVSNPEPKRVVLPLLPDYTGYEGFCLDQRGIVGIAPDIHVDGEHGFSYQFDFSSLERRDDIGMMLISNPSNPAGRTLGPDELTRLIEVAERLDAPLVIDNAYGSPFPCIGDSLASPVWHPNVLNLFTFSKAGLAGERVGFAIGHEELIDPMVSFVANSILHAPQLIQATCAMALKSGRIDSLTSTAIAPFYRARRALADALIREMMPEALSWRIHAGRGGMFSWLWITEDWFDDLSFYEMLKSRGVFIVPGRHFFIEPNSADRLAEHAKRCFRLSLSAPEDELIEGIGIVADTLANLRADRREGSLAKR
jgi:valine--pyruvate aminotransferase